MIPRCDATSSCLARPVGGGGGGMPGDLSWALGCMHACIRCAVFKMEQQSSTGARPLTAAPAQTRSSYTTMYEIVNILYLARYFYTHRNAPGRVRWPQLPLILPLQLHHHAHRLPGVDVVGIRHLHAHKFWNLVEYIPRQTSQISPSMDTVGVRHMRLHIVVVLHCKYTKWHRKYTKDSANSAEAGA